jgi:epidermal growth factor receptor substrate 15
VLFLQARSKLSQIQDSQQEMNKSIEQYNSTLNGTHRGSMTNLADMSEGFPDRENGDFGAVVRTPHCLKGQEVERSPYYYGPQFLS